jgi:hypothetical protein
MISYARGSGPRAFLLLLLLLLLNGSLATAGVDQYAAALPINSTSANEDHLERPRSGDMYDPELDNTARNAPIIRNVEYMGGNGRLGTYRSEETQNWRKIYDAASTLQPLNM